MAKQVRLSPSEGAEKWARRMVQATPDIQRGVDRVTENPADAAIKAKDKFVANLNAAIRDGKWERGLERVDLGDWKDRTTRIGIPRIAAGVDKAQNTVEEFQSQLFNHINSGLRSLESLPDVTPEQREQRMLAFSRHMRGMKRT